MAGGMSRERGGDVGVFSGTAVSCTHRIHTTRDRPKRCICTHADTKTHFVKLVLGLPLYHGNRDVDVFA